MELPIGNPWVAEEQAPPAPPWSTLPPAADLAAWFAGRRFPMAERAGFWFAHDVGARAVREVRLFTDVARPERVVPMERTSEGWFTLRLPAPEVDRVEYSFQVVDESGRVDWTLDPRNERRVDAPFGPKSEVLAPSYQAPPWIGDETPVPKGTLREVPIPGPHGNLRKAWVFRPAGFALDADLPIAIFLDGGDYLRYAGLRAALDYLIAKRMIAPVRAVFLPPARRFDEYSAGGRTALWLTRGLPRILARYFPVPRQADRRVGIGASLGGLALLHAHWTSPGFFGRLVLQSGSFFRRDSDAMEKVFEHFGRICRFVRSVESTARPAPPIPIRLSCGIAEENLVNNRKIHGVLRERGYEVSLTEFRDCHNWIAWRDALAPDLGAVLPIAEAGEET